jgi:hypothetical protein
LANTSGEIKKPLPGLIEESAASFSVLSFR